MSSDQDIDRLMDIIDSVGPFAHPYQIALAILAAGYERRRDRVAEQDEKDMVLVPPVIANPTPTIDKITGA